jgi:HAD superfamily hydrolase (TIGR01509 family)
LIKAVFFDLGKVLLDFEKNIIIERFIEKSGLTNEDITTAIDIYRVADLERGLTPAREFHQQVVSALQLDMTYDEFVVVWSDIFTEIPEMIELSQNMRAKYQTYIASNTDPIHFPYVFMKYKWISMFTGFALSYELKARKPEKEFFERALAKFKLQPPECVYIDDIEENVASARTVGINAILHESPGQTIKELNKLGIKA